MIVNVTDSNFDMLIKQASILVVDFWAEWCGPCRTLGKSIDTMAGKYSDIVFGKLNIDLNPTSVSKYGVKTIPTLLIFKDGKHTKTLIGVRSEEELIKQIRS